VLPSCGGEINFEARHHGRDVIPVPVPTPGFLFDPWAISASPGDDSAPSDLARMELVVHSCSSSLSTFCMMVALTEPEKKRQRLPTVRCCCVTVCTIDTDIPLALGVVISSVQEQNKPMTRM
jgi:hypothetical protein